METHLFKPVYELKGDQVAPGKENGAGGGGGEEAAKRSFKTFFFALCFFAVISYGAAACQSGQGAVVFLIFSTCFLRGGLKVTQPAYFPWKLRGGQRWNTGAAGDGKCAASVHLRDVGTVCERSPTVVHDLYP